MSMTLRALCVLVVGLALALPGCKKNGGSGSGAGRGGSLARFAIAGDTLYTLGGDRLNAFSLANPELPMEVGRIRVEADAETVFLEGSLLYVGARSGLYVYDVADPRRLKYVGEQRHVQSCDPVVVQEGVAFVTLRSGQRACRRGADELRVYDVSDPTRPHLRRTYPMRSPSGLGVDGDLLFVVDGPAGLKVFDATDPLDLRLQEVLPDLRGYDVIPNRGVLIVSGEDGLYQYDYRGTRLRLLSRLPMGKKSG
jgi:hypothetical protein